MRKVTAEKASVAGETRLHSSSQNRIASVNTATESVTMDTGSGTTEIAHAFCTDSAWVRSIPSPGTRVTLMYNQLTQAYDFVAYVPGGAARRLKSYAQGQSLYRSLGEGEHEIKSSGDVVTYWGSRCLGTTRAGAVKTTHDGENLEHITQAPTVHIKGHRNRRDSLGHEMRFGVVKRPLSATKDNIILKAPLSNPVLGVFNYAYEHMIKLNNDNDDPLVDIRIGEVYDDTPQPPTPFSAPVMGDHGQPLRARYRYHSTIEPLGIGVPETYTEAAIDSLGNVDVVLSKLAIVGFALRVPLGSFNMTSGLQANIEGKLGVSLTATAGSTSISGNLGVTVTTPMNATVSGKTGLDLKSDMVVTVEGIAGVNLKSKGKVSIHGMGGVSIAGAMGPTGQALASGLDRVCGVPMFIDPTVTC